MRKWRNDFASNYNTYYDIFEDWSLIESSFMEQYGIRLRRDLNTMKWGEFTSYLSGINGDTALGNCIRIRSEKDPKILKTFTAQEKKIRSDWLKKQSKVVSKNDYDIAMENFKNMFKSLAKVGDKK